MARMGEQTVFATATCVGCGHPLAAHGWHQNFVDITTKANLAEGKTSRMPGLVEWGEWRHFTVGVHPDADAFPVDVRPTADGRAVLEEPAPAADDIVHRYPHAVKWSDIEAFLRTIGLDPVDRNSLAELHITAHAGVEIVRNRKRLGANGKPHAYLAGEDIARQITTARIEWGK